MSKKLAIETTIAALQLGACRTSETIENPSDGWTTIEDVIHDRKANQETKAARIDAHAALDGLRVRKGWARQYSYDWLQKQMGLSAEACHILLFNVKQCKQVVMICLKAALSS